MTFRILFLLGALSAFAPFAIDMYLPAFSSLARSFDTDVEHVQLSLSAYFIGLAIGQLFYGPVADRFGRRIPLLVGITLFSLASLGCALAPTLEWLIVARFVQALGGCAGMVISRAVVRDLCDPIQAAKAFSQIMLVTGVAPILAPIGGGWLLNAFGWQAIFVSLALFAIACGFAVFRWLPESLPVEAPRSPLSGALRQYGRISADRSFMLYALIGGVAMAGMFAYIAGSPFVFIELYGVPAEHFGWVFGSNAAGFILFSQINARLLGQHGPAYWVPRATVLYGSATVLLLIVAAFQPATLGWLLVPLFFSIASLGCLIPNSSACAMTGQGRAAGSASALLGSIQFSIAALSSAAVGILHDGTARPMAGIMACCGIGAMILAWVGMRGRTAASDQA
ncbi:DHA1 family bicyclomycin/chloramphenicol resistance-like MFS transporter [Pseudomonas duriflava]|uniref:Bcr/CflA family efflux transporter n=1 Tax=Pseudomonas duriflava TaxID=459528 RepID=A0A562QDG3_9PSED|nr:multidrug effflux MFS transporter [Pseudomonas duriflava]TWI54791.1 DHA1 family bicyclomycin/chloramphenicol resistance-like MFS transporter [Pseudomonas duriflava]